MSVSGEKSRVRLVGGGFLDGYDVERGLVDVSGIGYPDTEELMNEACGPLNVVEGW